MFGSKDTEVYDPVDTEDYNDDDESDRDADRDADRLANRLRSSQDPPRMYLKLAIVLASFLLGWHAVNVLGSGQSRNTSEMELAKVDQLEMESAEVNPVEVDPSNSSSFGRGRRCLGLGDDEEMDVFLSKYDLVYLLTPMKAGSSSAVIFSSQCLHIRKQASVWVDDTSAMRTFIEYVREVPPFVTSRIYNHSHLIKTLKNSIRNSLIIYVHREETSRFQSAIKEVVTRNHNDTAVLEEAIILDYIEDSEAEIGNSVLKILNCESYETIVDTGADVVFLNYKSVDGILRLLGKRYCPELEIERMNSSPKPKKLVRVNQTYWDHTTVKEIELDDWLDMKANLLEHAFFRRSMASCQRETRRMEDRLLACPDQTLFYSSYEFSL